MTISQNVFSIHSFSTSMLDLELLFHCGYINNCYYNIVIITPKTQNLLHGWTSVNAYKPVNNWGLVWKQINHNLYWFNSKTSWHTAIIQFLIKYNNNSRRLFSISNIIKTVPVIFTHSHSEEKQSSVVWCGWSKKKSHQQKHVWPKRKKARVFKAHIHTYVTSFGLHIP